MGDLIKKIATKGLLTYFAIISLVFMAIVFSGYKFLGGVFGIATIAIPLFVVVSGIKEKYPRHYKGAKVILYIFFGFLLAVFSYSSLDDSIHRRVNSKYGKTMADLERSSFDDEFNAAVSYFVPHGSVIGHKKSGKKFIATELVFSRPTRLPLVDHTRKATPYRGDMYIEVYLGDNGTIWVPKSGGKIVPAGNTGTTSNENNSLKIVSDTTVTIYSEVDLVAVFPDYDTSKIQHIKIIAGKLKVRNQYRNLTTKTINWGYLTYDNTSRFEAHNAGTRSLKTKIKPGGTSAVTFRIKQLNI